jgi:hypothetical protein
MKEGNWKDCIESFFARHATPNKSKIASLIETANGRIQFVLANKPDKDNASYIFEGYYTSLLEALHAQAEQDGFHIENHICIGYYLRDYKKRDDLFRIFDDCRMKRNLLVYQGKRLSFEIAITAIQRCKILFEEIEAMIRVQTS